ncbi:hypothetical protein BDZ85DRAFT_320241 [Elsinoe ampelina]|uniref:BAH domain-containing protein n=1 Tax=Elsinoe ampelina TaxID=302913 RepID=A0A6A6G879_9PEZI|nr:hypothetical protein BDZ85DRAFT_320241 [Elsinoe ampelina]
MAIKRGADGSPAANGTNGVKRAKSDSATPNIESPGHARQQPVLTADERIKLGQWLDKKANDEIFKITYPGGAGKGKKGTPRPKGERLFLDGREYGDVSFAVANKPKWEQLTKYRRCTVSEQTFGIGECVFVRSDEDDSSDGNDDDGTLAQWKAQLHEVRALDENHVYLRVSWLYRPARDLTGGPRPYHGKYELIPSTEMAIIDAKTINGALKVKYWDEYKDDDVHGPTEYFWRQSIDHLSSTLSSLRTICSCAQPQNPDQQIVQCSNCNDWQHAKCLEEQGLEQYLAGTPSETNGAASNGTKPAKQKPKKGRASKGAATPKKTDAQGVHATLTAGKDGKGKVMIEITDNRQGEESKHELEPTCLLCEKALEGDSGAEVDVKQ